MKFQVPGHEKTLVLFGQNTYLEESRMDLTLDLLTSNSITLRGGFETEVRRDLLSQYGEYLS